MAGDKYSAKLWLISVMCSVTTNDNNNTFAVSDFILSHFFVQFICLYVFKMCWH